MSLVRTTLVTAIVLAATWAGSGIARAQHTFDILVQQASGQLVTAGCCVGGSSWSTGIKVFKSTLDDFGGNIGQRPIPDTAHSALVLQVSRPARKRFPATRQLFWDFMPMIINGQSQNMFYWDGKRPDGQYGNSAGRRQFRPASAADLHALGGE